jgi:hypothetical protein
MKRVYSQRGGLILEHGVVRAKTWSVEDQHECKSERQREGERVRFIRKARLRVMQALRELN